MTKVRYLVRWPGSLDLGVKVADRVEEGYPCDFPAVDPEAPSPRS